MFRFRVSRCLNCIVGYVALLLVLGLVYKVVVDMSRHLLGLGLKGYGCMSISLCWCDEVMWVRDVKGV